MKTSFNYIKERLKDSFFEIQTVGKEAVRQRLLPMDTYNKTSDIFQFIDWVPEDNCETIEYSFHDTEIGRLLVANTSKGICFLGFAGKNEEEIKADFMHRFLRHPMKEKVSEFQKLACGYCNGNRTRMIPLHLKGTAFQVGIWKQLVRIPEGNLSTYGSLSDDPGAARAVGTAVGANPVGYIIPCHRIVRSDGTIHGYRWGTELKKQLLAYELQA